MTNLDSKIDRQRKKAVVLTISDDHENARFWGFSLAEMNIEVVPLLPIDDLIRTWSQLIPDIVVIDMYGPELDVVQIIRQLREQSVMPIMLLMPWSNETFMLRAYRAGADECVIKPISPALFHLKIKVWLRHAWSIPAENLEALQVRGLKLDPAHRLVILEDGTSVKLTNLEFRLLHMLFSRPGWVFASDDIIQKVWGYHGEGNSNLLKNLIYRLRRKIDPDPGAPHFIHTEAGIGYKYQDIN